MPKVTTQSVYEATTQALEELGFTLESGGDVSGGIEYVYTHGKSVVRVIIGVDEPA